MDLLFLTWGTFQYKIKDRLVSLDRATGICNKCDTITPVEVLPSENSIRRIAMQIKAGELEPDSLEDTEFKLFTFKDRQTPARCLNCGAHDFDILPPVEKDPERARSRTPIRTGLVHKNCGGRIYGNPFGPIFFMGDKLTKRYFSIDGIEIT